MLRKTSLISAIAIALLAGCGGGDGKIAATTDGSKEAAIDALKHSDANAVAMQVAAAMEACSYDGKPVKFGMGGEAPGDCRDMIAQVMNFTGLPQNFDVTEANVPNAAAAILLDRQKIPRRVIAFNPEFIDVVKQATGGNAWAAVSVMAHEAGHHLAGHTIQPGGSQPPIELEADKFSGFVLYKMGASRDDALKAIKTLVPAQVPAGASHPARDARVAAISEGWDQACRQTGRGDCGNGAPGSTPPAGIVDRVAQTPVAPNPDAAALPPTPVATPAMAPVAAPPATTVPTVVVMPTPDPKALPTKGMRFVYDEVGLLDPGVVAAMEREFFDAAKQWGTEVVVIVAKDLHGFKPDDYAWSMMRQLRVGKLDVGNGAVLVYAPESREFGMALGPGIRNELAFHLQGFPQSAQRFYQFNLDWCRKQGRCPAGNSETLFSNAQQIAHDANKWEWVVRYQSLGEMQKIAARENEVDGGVPPRQSQVWRKITRLTGTVVALDPAPGQKRPFVNTATLEKNGRAVYVKTDDGLHAVLYFHPQTERLMPGGSLKAGQRYVFIAREAGLSWNPEDTQALELFSYMQL